MKERLLAIIRERWQLGLRTKELDSLWFWANAELISWQKMQAMLHILRSQKRIKFYTEKGAHRDCWVVMDHHHEPDLSGLVECELFGV